jgi:hypothetical protein|tara:strand:+ start:1178 stop:1771 length:594 start_codon:yes stop_codon:yes gene_type:complete
MKRILFFTPIFFMLASVNAQEQEVPAVPEVPAIYEDKEEEKVIKVEVVNNSSLDAAYPKGENELRVNALSFLTVSDINIFYERILNRSSSFGLSMFINGGDDVGDITDRKFAINPYYRFYFYNSKEYGARGFFVEGFSSFASLESESLQVSLGMSIGQKWVNTNGFSFELFLGLSRYITGSDNELYVPVGIAIGKRF